MTNAKPADLPTSLYDLTFDQLTAQFESWKQPRFRAGQVWRWLYRQLAADFDEMTDLGKDLRARLKEHYVLGRFTAVAERSSTDGWTRKWLLRLADGAEIETVLMEYDGARRTACVSSQAGCGMACRFCATGQMGFRRNLRAGEIVEQVIWVSRVLAGQERLTNVVLMGMGEPLANYSNVLEAVRRLMAPESAGGFGLGARRITLSTVGLAPGIRKFAAEDLQVNLAVSLHAATDALRDELVPVNRRYPLGELAPAIREYLRKTGRRVSFEWALIDGVNDTPEQAEALARYVAEVHDPQAEGRHLIHVNMIPLNPTGGYQGRASHRVRAHQFSQILTEAGIPNTIRVRRGIDISAGCGQLVAGG
jgi:23S rRNA (adenine2503-C2)-methyltransferase